MQLTPEDKLILSSVKINPASDDLERLNSLIPQIKDWESLTTNIIDRGIGPLFYKKLPLLSNQEVLPNEVKIKLQQAYYKTLSRSMVLYEAFQKVAKAFTSDGIQVVVLKGIYLSEWLYRDIALRQFSDMDLLVKPEDGEKCIAILKEMGFKPCDASVTEFIGSQTEIIHFAPMVLNDVSVEIHIRLHRKSKDYEIQVSNFIKNAVPVTINQVQVHALQLYDLLIHLCVHLDKHFRGGHIQFTCFNDITNVLDIHADEIDWPTFTVRCRENKCENLVFGYLMLIHKYFNTRLPKNIVQKYGSLLTKGDESLFYGYLQGVFHKKYHVGTHWQNIRQIKGFGYKARYFWDLIFPPKKFMIQKYHIKNPSLYRFYYPYRYWIGVKGVFKLVVGSLAKARCRLHRE